MNLSRWLLINIWCIPGFVLGYQEFSYTAAVIEYHPLSDPDLSHKEILLQNVKEYLKIIKVAIKEAEMKGMNLDIIIFPEFTLTFVNSISSELATEIPNISSYNGTVCVSNDKRYATWFKHLACAAKQYHVNLVVNLVEKEKCISKCPRSGYFLYNTNVAFDRNGAVVTRYRKYNLFGEKQMTKPKVPEVAIFNMDNKVKFGMFTCFDILFSKPALTLTRKENITNIIMTTMWFSQLPFLTALQMQQMWAMENNVNLLSAGANNPSLGSSGSGMFVNKFGFIDYKMTAANGTSIIFKKVTPSPDKAATDILSNELEIDSTAKDMDQFKLNTESFENYTSAIVDTSNRETIQSFCNTDFCCNFTLRHTFDKNTVLIGKNVYTYFLVVFKGHKGVYSRGTELCGLVACLNNSITSCGRRFKDYESISWPVTFQEITITSDFENSGGKIQFPSSLLSSIMPIPPLHTKWDKILINENKMARRRFSLIVPYSRILTFGIYGRDFREDGTGLDRNKNSFCVQFASNLCLVMSVIFVANYLVWKIKKNILAVL